VDQVTSFRAVEAEGGAWWSVDADDNRTLHPGLSAALAHIELLAANDQSEIWVYRRNQNPTVAGSIHLRASERRAG
jgi:hypothetical protein